MKEFNIFKNIQKHISLSDAEKELFISGTLVKI